MSNPKLKLSSKILFQDLTYCIEYFNENKFNEMNIGANRFLENCLLLDEHNLSLIGVFLKEIANDYLTMIYKKNPNFPLESSKVIGAKFLSFLKESFNNISDKNIIWDNFSNYTIGISEFQKELLEKTSYLKNPNFTNKGFDYLISWVNKNRDFLLYEHNKISDTIITSMVRMIKNHSCSKIDLICYVFFKTFGLLYPYVYFEYFVNKKLNEESMQKICFSFIEEINNLRKSKQIDFNRLDELLWVMIKSWREYYFKYKNSPFISPPVLEIPKKAIFNIIDEYITKKDKLNEL